VVDAALKIPVDTLACVAAHTTVLIVRKLIIAEAIRAWMAEVVWILKQVNVTMDILLKPAL